MNRTYTLLVKVLIVLGLVLTTACKKDPINNDPIHEGTDYSEMILGTWQAVLDSCYEKYLEDDGYQELTYASEWADSLTLTFRNNDTLTYYAIVHGYPDEWNDTYSVQADTLIWDKYHYKISKLTTKELIIHYQITEQHTTSGGGIRETSVTKHWKLTR